jgi:PAS domain S-box-containing protein
VWQIVPKPNCPIPKRSAFLLFLTALAFGLLFLPVRAEAASLSAVELEYIDQKGTITFVSQTHYPPFEFIGSDGDLTGMCIELVRWMAAEFGFKVRLTHTSFKQAQQAVQSGKADVLTSLFYSEKRDQIFDFSKEVFKVPASIFVVSDRPDIRSLNDLQGKTIAMQAGDYAQEYLESKHISFKVIYTKNFAEATDVVIAGQADAIIGDEQIVLYHIFSNNLTKRIKKVADPLYIGQNCLAAKDPNPILIGILNKGIDRARREGVLDQINKKWMGKELSPSPTRIITYVIILLVIAGLFGLTALMIWFWNFRLRAQMEARTAALIGSENTLRAILAASPVGIGLVRGRTLGWHNQAMSRMLGYAPGELTGRDLEILYPDRKEMVPTAETIKKVIQDDPSAAVETKWVRKDGSIFDCLIKYAPLPPEAGESMAITLAEDITERRRAEEALKQAEARARAFLQANPDPMVVYDHEGKTVYLNPAFTRVFGWTLEELKGRPIPFLPEDLKAATMANIKALYQEGKPVSYQTKRLTKYGRVLDVVISAAGIKDLNENVVEMVVNITDITAFKQAEAERLRLVTALEQAAETIVITDVNGTILYANPAFEKTSGYSIEEALGMNPSILKSGKQDEEFYRQLWTSILRGEVWSGHFFNKRKDGTLYEEEAMISPVRNEAGEIINFVAVKRDVTREVQLENQLRQAQKMEAIGTLAGGIAHDFNNILSAVMGFTELGLKKAEQGMANTAELQQVLEAAERAKDLVKHILTFSRKAEIELIPIQLNDVVSQSMKMIERTIPKMINIHLNLAGELKIIRGDIGQLHQIFLNLSSNSADAMPDGGKLIIRTENVTVTEDLCSACGAQLGGDFVRLEFIDTGQGMDEETLVNIFDPFFTTKEVGRGTGLGLSTVFGIVHAHGGHIVCHSRLGEGTRFAIYFPVSSPEEAPPEFQPPSFSGDLQGKESILLIDDEPTIRDIGKEVLTGFGYSPLLAASGEEALEIYREKGTAIDLVILDISMPGMGGHKCLSELLLLNPEVKVIIASGYSHEGHLKDTIELGARAYIRKPYSQVEMVKTIRRLLDES